jgi:hypothetical protein
MTQVPLGRIVRELVLGLLAIVTAAAVLVPSFLVVHLLYRSGLYQLLIATVGVGVLLMLYQARMRPVLRSAAAPPAASIGEAIGGEPATERARDTAAAFRIWGGVPLETLRVALFEAEPDRRSRLTPALCAYVRDHALTSAALAWAFAEVGGGRLLLLREPESIGQPLAPLMGVLAGAEERSFRHLWSAEGPAGYEQPVGFATVVLAQPLAGHEAELHSAAVKVGERVAALADMAGVEALMSQAEGAEPPWVLWLAAGRDRAVRRQVYVALEAAFGAGGPAQRVSRYDLIACDALVPLRPAGARSALEV